MSAAGNASEVGTIVIDAETEDATADKRADMAVLEAVSTNNLVILLLQNSAFSSIKIIARQDKSIKFSFDLPDSNLAFDYLPDSPNWIYATSKHQG